MEPQFQTSFIPKKPVDSGVKMNLAKEPLSIFTVVVWIIVIVTILASAVLFGYEQFLKGQVSQVEASISAAKQAFQPDTINQLSSVSDQISFTEQLLNSHVLVNKIFDTLENLTVKKIYFSDLTYTDLSGTPTIVMDGESQSYNALAEQNIAFEQSGAVQNPVFSDFNLATDGNISFKFTAEISPSLISYAKSVQAGAGQ